MTKKEITKRLLKDETCDNCKYRFVDLCTKDSYKDGIRIPIERTCKDFERGTYGRKLTWSQQSLQDLRAFHGLNVEEELIKAANEEMKNEIDKEMEKNNEEI